jgi:hypothetical protein
MHRLIAFAILAAAQPALADELDDALAGVVSGAPACTAAHCFGVHLHVASTDHALVATPEWLAASVANANAQLAAIDVGLRVIAADRNSAIRVTTIADRNAIVGTTGLHAGAIDVYVVFRLDDVDSKDTPPPYIRGVTWPLAGDPEHRKLIILSIAGSPRVLAHELGHFFGLPHSSYAISIMNKKPRDNPPIDKRRYADEEIPVMKKELQRLVDAKIVVGL